MKNKVFVVLVSVFALSISSSVNAEEKITGAFGIELGQTFNPQEAIGKGALTDGNQRGQGGIIFQAGN